MGDVSQGLSFDPTYTIRSHSPLNIRSPSPRYSPRARYERSTASPRRVSEIHIPSPDHSVSISSSEHFDKPGLVAAQEAALHDAAILEMGWTGADSDEYAFMPEGEKPKSPAVGGSQDLKSLKPIRLRNMKIGKVHRGRILSGTLCCKSVKIFAVMNVLEEEGTGDATKLVISNAVPRSATTATAQRLYPEGAQLSLREPYLKRFADGMVGILVENPHDIVFNYLPDEVASPVREGENILWPVYKDPCGDGPDTPVFNIYGSFLSTPSILSRTSPDSPSLNSPTTPRSPKSSSFSDDPADGPTVRTIRKFKSFRKQERGAGSHENDAAKDSPAKLSNGDDRMVEYEGGAAAAADVTSTTNSVQREGLEEFEPSVGVPSRAINNDGALRTDLDHNGKIDNSNGSTSIDDPSYEVSELPFSPTGGLISEPPRLVIDSSGMSGVESGQQHESSRDSLSFDLTSNNNLDVWDSVRDGEAAAHHIHHSKVNGNHDSGFEDSAVDESPRSSTSQLQLNNSRRGVEIQEGSVVGTGGLEVTDTSEVDESPAGFLEPESDAPSERHGHRDAETAPGGTLQASLDTYKQATQSISISDGERVGFSDPGRPRSASVAMAPNGGRESSGSLDEKLTMPGGGREKAEGKLRSTDAVEARPSVTSFSEPDGDENPAEGLQLRESLTEICVGSAVKHDDSSEGDLAGPREGVEDPAEFAAAGEQSEPSYSVKDDDDDASAFAHQIRVNEAESVLQLDKAGSSAIDSDILSNHSLSGSFSPAGLEEKSDTSTSMGSKSSQIVEEELSAAALRKKGNQRFANDDWNGAIELYTRAVHKAVKESKVQVASRKGKRSHSVISNGGETEMEVVMDYSNRAEAWLRLHDYERAWADAERALSIDPKHLKSLFRKGRALLGLGDYQQALTHLESAYTRAPFDKDLLAAIKLTRIRDHQSRLGIYELTDYYLRGRFAGEIPTSGDYVGPVQIKAAGAGKGRGLFLTKHVEAGDLLLVSNPLAKLDSVCDRKISLLPVSKGRIDLEVEEKLVQAVRERVKISSKNRQKLATLCDGGDSDDGPVPSMDLFIHGRKIAPTAIQNLDEERITHAIVRNAIDSNMVSVPLEKRRGDVNEDDAENREERYFWGLWVLPAFINHSCIPNVSLVVIGRAMFVYASRDLSAGEELHCSYFNVFQPLPQRREIASRCWGFTCKCARCVLESQFEEPLKNLYSLHCDLRPNPLFRLQLSPSEKKIAAQDLAKELQVIEGMKKLDHRQRCWLQASFTQLYSCADFKGPTGKNPYLETALQAMQVVSPGSSSTLEVGLLVRETALKESNGKKASQYKSVNQQLLRICHCIYGKQKAAVLQSLVDGISSDITTKS